jgi:hypothetical protein
VPAAFLCVICVRIKDAGVHMTTEDRRGEFPQHSAENRRIWDANARWWDDRIGDGNEFQTELIEPATERLLEIVPGDTILGCGLRRRTIRAPDGGARRAGSGVRLQRRVRRARPGAHPE